jgi:hypothetical protein
MLEVLVGASARSAILVAAVWLILLPPPMRRRQIHSTAWTVVLAASLLMPVATWLAAIAIPSRSIPCCSIAWQSLAAPVIGEVAPARADPPLTRRIAAAETTSRPADVRPGGPGDAAVVIADLQHDAQGGSVWARWYSLTEIIYGAVCGAMLVRLAIGLLLTARIARAAIPVRDNWTSGFDVCASHAIAAPATFGRVILLPLDHSGWSPTRRLAVLTHEGAHVSRGDFYVQIAARVNRAIFWFSPLSWWLPRQLSELVEALCDDAAIDALSDRAGYAEILLEFCRHARPAAGLVSMARPATVRDRIERILSERTPPAFVSRPVCLVVAAGLLPLVVTAASPVTFGAPAPGSPMTGGMLTGGVITGGLATGGLLTGGLLTGGQTISTRNEMTSDDIDAPHQRIVIDPEALAEFVGYHELSQSCIIAVTRDGDQLFAQPIDEKDLLPYPIFQYGEREFFYTAFAGQLTFLGSRDGAATALILHQNGRDRMARRVSADVERSLLRRLADERNLTPPSQSMVTGSAAMPDGIAVPRLP